MGRIVARLAARLDVLRQTAVPVLTPDKCGCKPVITRGAWRPCDAPDPGVDVLGVGLSAMGEPMEEWEWAAEGPSGYALGRRPFPYAAPPSSPKRYFS